VVLLSIYIMNRFQLKGNLSIKDDHILYDQEIGRLQRLLIMVCKCTFWGYNLKISSK